jgi:hypothetical protein
VGWQETGTPGAICYQIATKKTKWVQGLSRGGLSRSFGNLFCEVWRLRIPPYEAGCSSPRAQAHFSGAI